MSQLKNIYISKMQNLPSEVISRSLRYAGMPQTSRQLSTAMYTSSAADYMEALCNEPINEDEIQDYMTENITFGRAAKFFSNKDFAIYTPIGDKYYSSFILTVGSREYMTRYDISGRVSSLGTIDYRPAEVISYDLITTYRILKRRLG